MPRQLDLMNPPTPPGVVNSLLMSISSSCTAAGPYIKVFQLSDVCVIHSVWKQQQLRCLSGLVTHENGKIGRKREEEGGVTALLPSNLHSIRNFSTLKHKAHTQDNLFMACVLWSTPSITTSNYWPGYLVMDTNHLKCSLHLLTCQPQNFKNLQATQIFSERDCTQSRKRNLQSPILSWTTWRTELSRLLNSLTCWYDQ